MTLGGFLLILLIISIIPICYKVREHSSKLKELEEGTKKPAVKK